MFYGVVGWGRTCCIIHADKGWREMGEGRPSGSIKLNFPWWGAALAWSALLPSVVCSEIKMPTEKMRYLIGQGGRTGLGDEVCRWCPNCPIFYFYKIFENDEEKIVCVLFLFCFARVMIGVLVTLWERTVCMTMTCMGYCQMGTTAVKLQPSSLSPSQ